MTKVGTALSDIAKPTSSITDAYILFAVHGMHSNRRKHHCSKATTRFCRYLFTYKRYCVMYILNIFRICVCKPLTSYITQHVWRLCDVRVSNVNLLRRRCGVADRGTLLLSSPDEPSSDPFTRPEPSSVQLPLDRAKLCPLTEGEVGCGEIVFQQYLESPENSKVTWKQFHSTLESYEASFTWLQESFLKGFIWNQYTGWIRKV